jgi:ATP-binding cassette, subfamily B, bacterial
MRLGGELTQLVQRGREVWALAEPRHRRRLGVASLLMALASGATTALALLLGVLVDRIALSFADGRDAEGSVWIVLGSMAGVYLARESLHVARRALVERSCTQIHRDLLVRLTRHALRLDLSDLAGQRIGALHGRIVRSVDGFVRFVRLMFLDCLPAVSTGAIAIVATLVKEPLLGLVMLGVVPAAVWLTIRQLETQKGVRLALMRDHEAVDALVIEQLQGVEYFRVTNSVELESERLAAVAEKRRHREVRHHFEMSLYGCGKALNEAFFHLVVLGVSAWLALQGRISVGDVMTFSALYLNVMAPLSELHRILDEGHEAGMRVADLTSLLATPEDRSFRAMDNATARCLGAGQPVIEVEHLTVTYCGSDGGFHRALDDVSVVIQSGESIGVAGPSGSGKSTWIKVLLRILHPTSGSVRIAGRPVETLSREAIASLFGYVGQNPFVYSASIADNIAYGLPMTDREEIERAAMLAGIHEEIIERAAGYEDLVAERGANLSGGQRQRLALARALLQTPPILILDEATSALDNISERQVQESLQAQRGEQTTIVIAHRLSTLRDCDRILVFDDGRIAESGTYGELIQRDGVFAKLVSSAANVPQDSSAAGM